MSQTMSRSVRTVLALSIVASMAFLTLPLPGIGIVSADSYQVVSDAARDGYLSCSDASYPPDPATAITYNSSSLLYTGQFKNRISMTYYIYRSYVSFDTSFIPDSAVVQSVNLKMRLQNDYSDTDFNVMVYGSEFGSLDDSDWNVYAGFQGVLLNSASASSGSWYSLAVMGSSVNKTGYTGFMLKSNYDNGTMPPGGEYLVFYSGDSLYAPVLEVTYSNLGTTVSIQTTTGSYYNSTAFADVQDWNLTYDLWCYEFDTIPNADNVTITKGNSTWLFQGVTPLCNYTDTSENLTLEDVFDSICYRVWFTVPIDNPYSVVHISLYNSFTGEGYFWEQMKVMICEGEEWDDDTARSLSRPDFNVEPETNYTIRVLDYFDNTLVDYPFVANAEELYLSIPVPVYSWQVFNMNEQPVLMKIYWNGSGAPWEFFVGPQWIMERLLKGGNYTFMVTFYESDGTAGVTVSYDRTIPNSEVNASFIYINGTTLSEIVSDIEGVAATQEIITSIVSPSIRVIYEDLPLAPVNLRSLSLESAVTIDPYLILEATTYQNGTGTNTSLYLPHPDLTGATYYIMSDVLSFSGNYSTDIYINETGGSTLFSSTILPATHHLDGENVTIWSSESISVSRATVWREITEYAVDYYPSQKKYQCVVNLNNTMSIDMHSPYWYIGFPADTTIAQDSVVLYDIDNGITLSQEVNFEVTAGGVHVTLTKLNASDTRSFRITYYDFNSTSGIGAPNLIAYTYDTASYDGAVMKHVAVQWSNPWSIVYEGEVYITLNFTGGDSLKASSIHIVETLSGRTLADSQYVYTGRTIIILTNGVGDVGVGGGVNFQVYFTFDGSSNAPTADFFFGPIVIGGQQFYIGDFPVSIALIVIIVAWIGVIYAYMNQRKDWLGWLFIVISLTVIFGFAGVVTT